MWSTWILPSELLLFCVTEQHAMHELLQWITFNMQPILNIFKWIKTNKFCNMNSYSLIEQYVTRKTWQFSSSSSLSFLETNSKWLTNMSDITISKNPTPYDAYLLALNHIYIYIENVWRVLNIWFILGWLSSWQTHSFNLEFFFRWEV